MPVASFTIVAKQVITLFNAQATTTAYPTSATDIGTSKRNSDEIKEAVIDSDIEARWAICETPGNGYRPNFVVPLVLAPLLGNAQSARLPERIGPVSRVEIRVHADDTEWIAGEQCPLSEIQEMLANPDIYQNTAHDSAGSPLAGYYYIDEMADVITWTGNAIRVYVAQLGAVDRATPALLSPDAYVPFLVARSIARLYKHGDNLPFIEWYSRQADQLMALIRKGETVLPSLEPIARAA
jgi:hypothetical protein